MGGACIDEAKQHGAQIVVPAFAVAAARLRCACRLGVELGPADPDRLGHNLHRDPSFGNDGGSHVRF